MCFCFCIRLLRFFMWENIAMVLSTTISHTTSPQKLRIQQCTFCCQFFPITFINLMAKVNCLQISKNIFLTLGISVWPKIHFNALLRWKTEGVMKNIPLSFWSQLRWGWLPGGFDLHGFFKGIYKVRHCLLLDKMSSDVEPAPYQWWLRSYFSGRVQHIKMRDCVSRDILVRRCFGIP
jgi:hypothetical protein